MIEYCPCKDETIDPGATIKGDDKVHGICQARYGYREKWCPRIILVDKQTGKEI